MNAELNATLVLVDESGFSLVSPLKRSCAPKGQTPRLRISLSHHTRLSLIGTLLVSPRQRRVRLHVRSYTQTVNGEWVEVFLRQLLAAMRGHLVLVWDNALIHRRQSVQRFIAAQVRLRV